MLVAEVLGRSIFEVLEDALDVLLQSLASTSVVFFFDASRESSCGCGLSAVGGLVHAFFICSS